MKDVLQGLSSPVLEVLDHDFELLELAMKMSSNLNEQKEDD